MRNDIALDLQPWKLDPGDIDARALTTIDLEAYGFNTALRGYRIPYYDIGGRPVKHSRIRELPPPGQQLLTGPSLGVKHADAGGFLRINKTETRVYFPIGFHQVMKAPPPFQLSDRVCYPLFVVDDERVAAHIMKIHKWPAVAIQGPAGWQSHAGLAEGFRDLCEAAVLNGLTVVMWIGDGTQRNIQREVANAAMEFKFQGAPFANVRQYTHDRINQQLLKAVLEPKSAFPRHPNIRQYVSDKIGDQGHKLTRKDNMEVGLAILADMESHGIRIKSTTDGFYYYFDHETKELTKATIALSSKELISNSEFMNYIYQRYGLSSNDYQILHWFARQFVSEEPIYRTQSYKVMMAEPRIANSFAIQLTPSEFVYIPDSKAGEGMGDAAKVVTNGTNNILFERGSVESLDVEKLHLEIDKQRKHRRLPMWWLEVIKEVRMDKPNDFKIMMALIYYISPWLRGWREIQLPIEVVVGEAGTGKSSLFALRMKIMTGRAALGNLPENIKDWHSRVINSAGLMVADNVHLASKSYRQALSDEMCRLITEPRPTIEMRQLYTTADVARFPVNCTFGITSIENVFTNVDFIQRAIIVPLDKSLSDDGLNYDWYNLKLQQYGGREAWLAHHIVAMERFYEEVRNTWQEGYKSKSRLINFEQALITMGRVFGKDCSWVPETLAKMSATNAVALDWVLEGLHEFTRNWVKQHKDRRPFTSADIVAWAETNEQFEDNHTLTNARRLGRYISTHKTTVYQTTGITAVKNTGKTCLFSIEKVTGLLPSPEEDKRANAKRKGRTAKDTGDW